jgi:LysR family transcriptional activator of nhaA
MYIPERLNYQHLLYFWTVAREGSIARACERLHLAQPTVSAQLRLLEDSLGQPLFTKVGRRLVLTDTGRMVFRYAEQIFSLGKDLLGALKGRSNTLPTRLQLGIVDIVPKMIIYRLIEPALRLEPPVQIVCYEDKAERLLMEISLREMDMILSDIPATPSLRIGIANHLLGECGVSVFGAPSLVDRYRRHFPASLDGAPFLLPTNNTALRHSLDQWFDANGIRPLVRGEIEDSALIKAFGHAGAGLFLASTAIETEIQEQYGVEVLGRLDTVRERFYAITTDRKDEHPAIKAILTEARERLFG